MGFIHTLQLSQLWQLYDDHGLKIIFTSCPHTHDIHQRVSSNSLTISITTPPIFIQATVKNHSIYQQKKKKLWNTNFLWTVDSAFWQRMPERHTIAVISNQRCWSLTWEVYETHFQSFPATILLMQDNHIPRKMIRVINLPKLTKNLNTTQTSKQLWVKKSQIHQHPTSGCMEGMVSICPPSTCS